MTTLTAPPVHDTRAVISQLRTTRSRRQLGDTDWGDLAYRVYTTAFFCLVITVMISGSIGDDPLSAQSVRDVAAAGPAWAGLLFAAILLGGIRSGARGGPLSLDEPDVTFLLLTPTNRSQALRRPSVTILAYGIGTGAAVGGVVGSLFSQRLPGGGAEWVGAGALFGSILVSSALGAALLTCSRIVHSLIPKALGWGLLVWSIAEVADSDAVPVSPTNAAGALFFWPIRTATTGLAWVPVALILMLIGAALIGGLSIEAARRRTTLVGQLRFAVTLQDLRSVMLLRRQLASELPRNRSWFRVPRWFARRFPVTARDLRSVSHWPLVRILRVPALAVGAALAVRGMWSGTTPLVIVAGLAAFVAALDTTEGLSQDIDHPTILDSFPENKGVLMLRHLVGPAVVLAVAGAIGVGVAWAVDPQPEVLGIGAITVVMATAAAVAGAAISIISPTDSGGAEMVMTPEVAGPRLVFRTAGPPLVATAGFLPALIAARSDPAEAVSVAGTVSLPVGVLVAIVIGWVRFRTDIHASIAETMPQTDRENDDDDGD